MVTATKKSERIDLEKIAKQLANVKITPVVAEDHIALRATATFTTKTFTAGKYKVAVGIRQAILHLDHPSFERESAYQATLAKETWSESWKNLKATHAGGEAKANIGGKFFGFFGGSAEAQAGKNRRESAEQTSNAPYRIISATPTGWQIGTELGDPRTPTGALADGLEHCLTGEYLSGRHEENGDGVKDKYGGQALCILKVKPGGNDPRVVATLFGVSGSLKVAITLSEEADSSKPALQSESEKREHEDLLRRTFVEICLHRAEQARKEGAHTDAMLSGDVYLNHHEIHVPKLQQTNSLEKQLKPLATRDDQSTYALSSAREKSRR